MDPNTAKVLADHFALARVDPDTELDAQLRWRGIAERDASPHSTGWPVEGGENAIARGLYDAASVTADLAIRDSVVAFKDFAPEVYAIATPSLCAYRIGLQVVMDKALHLRPSAASFPARSVVARRGLKNDSLELGECVAAQPKCGLETLESEFASVERPSQFIECRSLVVEHLVARSVEQDQVSRAPEGMREAYVPFALESVEALEGQNDALPRLKSLENGGGEKFAGALVDLV
jgi:hypothetical protein